MMYTIMVSNNCGINYFPDQQAETVEELYPRMRELDEEGLCWGVDKDGEPCFDVLCGIHAALLKTVEVARTEQALEQIGRLQVPALEK